MLIGIHMYVFKSRIQLKLLLHKRAMKKFVCNNAMVYARYTPKFEMDFHNFLNQYSHTAMHKRRQLCVNHLLCRHSPRVGLFQYFTHMYRKQFKDSTMELGSVPLERRKQKEIRVNSAGPAHARGGENELFAL